MGEEVLPTLREINKIAFPLALSNFEVVYPPSNTALFAELLNRVAELHRVGLEHFWFAIVTAIVPQPTYTPHELKIPAIDVSEVVVPATTVNWINERDAWFAAFVDDLTYSVDVTCAQAQNDEVAIFYLFVESPDLANLPGGPAIVLQLGLATGPRPAAAWAKTDHIPIQANIAVGVICVSGRHLPYGCATCVHKMSPSFASRCHGGMEDILAEREWDYSTVRNS